MLASLKKDNALSSGQTALAKASYHTARYGIHDAYLADLVQETVEAFKGKIMHREAFGFFYAALKLSWSKHMISFLRSEYERGKEDLVKPEGCLNSILRVCHVGRRTFSQQITDRWRQKGNVCFGGRTKIRGKLEKTIEKSSFDVEVVYIYEQNWVLRIRNDFEIF